MRSTVALMLVVFGFSAAGCSLIYTKGPQPDVKPPPPCTTSNSFPTADAVLAAVSVAAVVAGAVVYASGTTKQCSGGEWFCGFSEQVGGGGAMVIGGITTLIFTPSAIVGYMRTADCRAWLEANPQYAPPPAPPESSTLAVSLPGCAAPGDAPRVCSAATPSLGAAVPEQALH